MSDDPSTGRPARPPARLRAVRGPAIVGLASVALPGPELDWTLFAVAAGLTVLIAIAGLPRR